jgi:hypothetical protein
VNATAIDTASSDPAPALWTHRSRATVIGRAVGELITMRTDAGREVTVRVLPDLWAQLDLGRRASLELADNGRARSITPLTHQRASLGAAERAH